MQQPMEGDARIDELLDRWEQCREEGRTISVEDLCRDHPDLIEEVRKRIQDLDWLDDVMAAPTSAELKNNEPPRHLGRYELLELIGRGGFGQVWRAYDPKIEREVAIKVLNPDRSRSTIQVDRFLAEARKVGRLHHKNILPVYDVGREGEWCYMVAALIKGSDLAQRVRKGQVNPREAVALVAKVADGLQYAHDHGVIHRDIKPHNILVDSSGEPYITDFGIAVTESELLGNAVDTAGSPAYMAPEQASCIGAPVDPRVDVYGLGVVLYELLVGEVPYPAETLTTLRSRHAAREIVDPVAANPNLPPALGNACLKAIANDPEDRWASAGSFAVGLRELLPSVPSSLPPSRPQTPETPARQNSSEPEPIPEPRLMPQPMEESTATGKVEESVPPVRPEAAGEIKEDTPASGPRPKPDPGLDGSVVAILTVCGLLLAGLVYLAVTLQWQSQRLVSLLVLVFLIGSGMRAFFGWGREAERSGDSPRSEPADSSVSAFRSERIVIALVIGIAGSVFVSDWASLMLLPGLNATKLIENPGEYPTFPIDGPITEQRRQEIVEKVRGIMKQEGFLGRRLIAWPFDLTSVLLLGLPMGWTIASGIGGVPNNKSPFDWLRHLAS